MESELFYFTEQPMPWMIKKDGDLYCVHKENADGSAGEKVKCHPTEEAAKQHMKALYANATGKEKMQAAFSSLLSTIKNALHLSDESLDEKVQAVRDGFYQTFDRIYSEPMPGCYVKEVYDGYVIVEEGEKLYKVKYSFDADGKVVFDARDQWQAVQMQYVNMQSGFSFTELSADQLLEQPLGLKYMDGLAAGTFVCMTGEEVTFKPDELQTYIDNTSKIIESTRTESGEIVGLPIDKDKHDHAGGAGWIVGLELDPARNVIRFLVNWTQEGIDLIKGNIRRFFSPSTDPDHQVILGGSLTNWPATRLETGEILLKPVELSQSIKEIDMPKTLEELFAGLQAGILEAIGRKPADPPEADPPATETSPTLRELLNTPEAVEELGQRAQQLAQEAIQAEKRKLHAVQFAARIAGGTKEKPFGLRVKPNEIVALLLSLPEKQARAVEKILDGALDSAIDFAEHGFDSEGFIQKPTLPEAIKPYARLWVDAGKPIGEFFAQNPELGSADNYNLTEFIKVKE